MLALDEPPGLRQVFVTLDVVKKETPVLFDMDALDRGFLYSRHGK